MTTKQIKFNDDHRGAPAELQPLPFTVDAAQPKKQSVRQPPPPSPSKFIKGEFKESDYESDYDHKIHPIWRPGTDSDSEPMYYKPIRPLLTPTGNGRNTQLSDGQSPVPPCSFEQPLQFEGPPRPKFQPIEKPKTTPAFIRPQQQQQHQQPQQPPPIFKPVPARAQTQPPPNRPAAPPTQYYTAVTGPPQHHIATETRNQMHMRESTETAHRVVNVMQTKRVVQLDAQQPVLEPFPYVVESPGLYQQQRSRLPPPPTPTKFVPAEFRDTDYESEVDSTKIRPLWTPNPSDSDEPQYRRVQPPQQNRSASVPRTYGRVQTPMEFDTKPIELPSKIDMTTVPKTSPGAKPAFNQTHTLDRFVSTKQSTSTSTSQRMMSSTKTMTTTTNNRDVVLKPASPPKYGFMPGAMEQSTQQGLKSAFMSSKHYADHEVRSDVRASSVPAKPILKKPNESGAPAAPPQAYRDESRVSQYGKLRIDFVFTVCESILR